MQLAAGDIFQERYEILECIGSGGFGAVYRARQIDVNRIIALKIIHSVNLDDPENLKRFSREGKVLAKLQHKNIVTFYHFGFTAEGVPFAAMEYLAGRSLGNLISEEGRLGPERAVHIMRQICAALGFAHSMGVIHRDLKPDNIMLLAKPEADTVKIIDFGLAKLSKSSGMATGKLTKTGLLIGSIQYMTPEQAQGRPVDARSDIYTLGCIFHEMLTGKKPFDADNAMGLLYKHANESAPEFLKLEGGNEIPAYLERVCQRAMEKNPEARFQSMDEFALALDPNSSPVSGLPKPAAKKTPRLFFVGVTALVLMTASASYFALCLSPGHRTAAALRTAVGEVYFLSTDYSINPPKIIEVHLKTKDGMVKVCNGTISNPNRYWEFCTDLQLGQIWKIKYENDSALPHLLEYRSVQENVASSESANVVTNFICFLAEQKYDLMVDSLSEKYIEKHSVNASRENIESNIRKAFPPGNFLTKINDYLSVPQYRRVLKSSPDEVCILVNTAFVYKQAHGFLKFYLKKNVDGINSTDKANTNPKPGANANLPQDTSWQIEEIETVSADANDFLNPGAQQVPLALRKGSDYQFHKGTGTVVDIRLEPLGAQSPNEVIVTSVLLQNGGEQIVLRGHVASRDPAQVKVGAVWNYVYKGDEKNGELESFHFVGVDTNFAANSKSK